MCKTQKHRKKNIVNNNKQINKKKYKTYNKKQWDMHGIYAILRKRQ